MIRPLVPSVISSFSHQFLQLSSLPSASEDLCVLRYGHPVFFFKFQNQLFKLRLKFSNIWHQEQTCSSRPSTSSKRTSFITSASPHPWKYCPSKIPFWRCPSMMPFNEAFQRCPSKMPLKDPPQRCPSEMPLKDAPQRCHSKMPLKDAPQRCASKIPLPFRIDALPRWP